MRRNFNFSYSLDWVLKGYTKPVRDYQSRFALIVYEYDYVDICGVAIGLLRMYQFFRDGVERLQKACGKEEVLAA